MRILITGISGFIGQALAERLAAIHSVHGIYEHASSTGKNPMVHESHKHVVDLTNHEAVKRLVEQIQPEVVLHLASRSEVAYSFDSYVAVTETNYVAVVNLAEACRRFCPELQAFVMASTMETYGNANPITGLRVFDEQTPQYPMAPYAVAKLATEKYLAYMRYAYDFPSIVLRQTNTYGRRDNAFFIVERIITQMLAGNVCNLGVAWPVRNFLFIDDLVDIWLELIGQLPVGETFVTGPDNALTIAALVDLVAFKLDWKGVVNWGTVPERAAEVPYLNSTPAKARRVLGWRPKVTLEEGLDRTIEMWRERPAGTLVPDWVAAGG